LRLALHNFEIKVLILKDRIKLLKNPLRDFFTLVGLDLFNETFRIVHHLLSVTPSVILLLTFEEDQHSLCDNNTISWWVSKSLQLLD